MGVDVTPICVEFGRVKNFFPEKGYGFVRVLDGFDNPTDEEVFFHAKDRHWITASKEPWFWNQPLFAGKERLVTTPTESKRLPEPGAGDLLVFVYGESQKKRGNERGQADRWGYASQWYEALSTLAGVHYPMRLVVDWIPKCADAEEREPKPASCVLWEGHDVVTLSLCYPVNPKGLELDYSKRREGRDSLRGVIPPATPVWAPYYKWEAKVVGGEYANEWVGHDDPRIPDCCLPASSLAKGWRRTELCVHTPRRVK